MDVIRGSIKEFLEDGRTDLLFITLRRVVKVKGGMTWLAKQTGLSREGLYKTLSGDAKPRFETIVKILDALGYSLVVKKNAQNKAHKKAA